MMNIRIVFFTILLQLAVYSAGGCAVVASQDEDNSYEEERLKWCLLQFSAAAQDGERQSEILTYCFLYPALFEEDDENYL